MRCGRWREGQEEERNQKSCSLTSVMVMDISPVDTDGRGGPVDKRKRCVDLLVVNGHGQFRLDQLDQLNALRGIHSDHDQGHVRARDGGATEMDEHQVDGLPGVGVHFGDLLQVLDVEGVSGDVDAVAALKVLAGRVSELQHPTVGGWDGTQDVVGFGQEPVADVFAGHAGDVDARLKRC